MPLLPVFLALQLAVLSGTHCSTQIIPWLLVFPFLVSKSTSVTTIIWYNLSWMCLMGSHGHGQNLPGQLSSVWGKGILDGRGKTAHAKDQKQEHGRCFVRSRLGKRGWGRWRQGRLVGTEVRWEPDMHQGVHLKNRKRPSAIYYFLLSEAGN